MIETNILSGAPAKAEIGTGTIEIGTVTAGDEAAVENVGSKRRVRLNFTLPRGEKGEKGERGEKGDPGDAAVTAERIEAALGYVPKDVVICEITGSGTAASPYVSSMLPSEVMAACTAGKIVLASLNRGFYPLVAMLGMQFAVFGGITNGGKAAQLQVMPNKSVAKYEYALAPLVTAEDNGKVLKVVNGRWAAVAE